MGRLLWEMLDRTTTGPIMKEEEFETELFPTKMAEIVARHKIERDPDEPIMSDPGMADEIFQAGLELLVEVGLYCKDTKRIVKFTEEEIKEVSDEKARRYSVDPYAVLCQFLCMTHRLVHYSGLGCGIGR